MMKPLVVAMALNAPAAPSELITLEVTGVQHITADTYVVSGPGAEYLVEAPAASALPDLENFDAFSEDWFCRLKKSKNLYALIDCTSGQPPN